MKTFEITEGQYLLYSLSMILVMCGVLVAGSIFVYTFPLASQIVMFMAILAMVVTCMCRALDAHEKKVRA